ncbi:hypothetical protein SPH9361_04986 [Sphingobium sp. CECT 9361]|nr:hypothetical protein SPH9361_04986 [Sphingobium sp. CECT 9361]
MVHDIAHRIGERDDEAVRLSARRGLAITWQVKDDDPVAPRERADILSIIAVAIGARTTAVDQDDGRSFAPAIPAMVVDAAIGGIGEPAFGRQGIGHYRLQM